MKNIYIYADWVCERRKLDAQRIANFFTANGERIVSNPKFADIMILSTCGATGALTEGSFKELDRLSKYPGELIVVGCLPDTDKTQFDNVFSGRYLTVRNFEKFDSFFPNYKIKFSNIKDTNQTWMNKDVRTFKDILRFIFNVSNITKGIYLFFESNFMRYMLGDSYLLLENRANFVNYDYYVIRVSWGCSQNCAYCGTKLAVGRFRSKPLELCIKEFKTGLELGYCNFDVNSEDIGSYGKDLNISLPNLLNELTSFEDNCNIVFGAMNPFWLVKYLDEFDKIFKCGKISAMITPIQSGNSRVLNLMNRYSEINKIQNAFNRIKNSHPDLKIGTHIIVGFPTETFEEFRESVDFIIETGINMGVFNPMSIKPRTKAEKLYPKISKEEIHRRVKYAKTKLRKNGYRALKMEDGLIFGKNIC